MYLKKTLVCSTLILLLFGYSSGGNSSEESSVSYPYILFDEIRDAVADRMTNRMIYPAILDFNGDGLDDILMTFIGWRDSNGITYGEKLKVFVQDGKGGMVEATDEILGPDSLEIAFARKILVGDFNGDNKEDVYFANHGIEFETDDPGRNWGEPDVLLLSQSDGTWKDMSATHLPANNYYSHGAASGDIDNDGDIDILVNAMNWPPLGVLIYKNDGTGKFTEAPGLLPKTGGKSYPDAPVAGNMWVELIDADNDNDLDLFKPGTIGENDHWILLNDGTGDFSTGAPIDLPPYLGDGETVCGAAVGDVNSDGLDDLIVMNSFLSVSGNAIQLLISQGDGHFTDETTDRIPPSARKTTNTDVHFEDFNNDGHKDILKYIKKPNAAELYKNDGTGHFTRMPEGTLNIPESRVPIDIMGDGTIQYIASGRVPGYPRLAAAIYDSISF